MSDHADGWEDDVSEEVEEHELLNDRGAGTGDPESGDCDSSLPPNPQPAVAAAPTATAVADDEPSDAPTADDAVQLISDGGGLAVIGEPGAVERYLRSLGWWADSRELDLRRLKPVIRLGSNLANAASELAANSGRWIKLTEESARLVKEHGLIETKTPGVSHVMIGMPGKIGNWLQAEHGQRSMFTNPAVLSGVAGLMAQVASQQAVAEVIAYLAKIDVKVDDVLRTQEDQVVARMIGVGFAVEEAMTVREMTGTVNEVTWGKVEGTSETIGATQAYALLQLKALAEKFESATGVGGLAGAADHAVIKVRDWLAVLARCSELQSVLDVLELDRVFAVSPDELNSHRLGLRAARQDRLDRIAAYTKLLLDRIDAACGTANAKIVWHWTDARTVVRSGNHVAARVDDFHQLLGIKSDPRSWEPRQLERAAEIGAQAIQTTKDKAPSVLAYGAVLLGGSALKNKFDNEADSS